MFFQTYVRAKIVEHMKIATKKRIFCILDRTTMMMSCSVGDSLLPKKSSKMEKRAMTSSYISLVLLPFTSLYSLFLSTRQNPAKHAFLNCEFLEKFRKYFEKKIQRENHKV